MGLLDASEEPKSRLLRYSVTAVALVILITFGFWYSWYLFFFMPERHTVEHFMNAVLDGNLQQAYQIWKPHSPSYSFQDFTSDWGPKGYYSPIKSYRLEAAEVPPKGGTGVVVTVELSEYDTFPKSDETIKNARLREVQVWVERSDQSMSFPPP